MAQTPDSKMRPPNSDNHSQQPPKIYHERQSKQLCALHALNNLFQDPQAFSKQSLDAICKQLSPDSNLFNPHRSALGLGCYDVNVVIAALSEKGYEVVWFDKRKNIDRLCLDNIFGFILNVPNTLSNGFFSIPLNYIPIQARIWSSEKHWIAIRKVGSHYYNLDSKILTPYLIGDDNALFSHLKLKCSEDNVEILIVVDKSVSEDQRWNEDSKLRND